MSCQVTACRGDQPGLKGTLQALALAPAIALVSGCSGGGGAQQPSVPQGSEGELGATKSGISVLVSGVEGTDWAIESTYHDEAIADTILFVKSHAPIALAHNSRNTITIDTPSLPHVIGQHGNDGVPNSGDEGHIHFKVDRDLQSNQYSTKLGPLPEHCVRYTTPFSFDHLTYDGATAVLGATGDNGGGWGVKPSSTVDRFAYGQLDAAGNEWHTLTYWDDDEALLAAAGVSSNRQGASDGHCVSVCVNPVTPVIQLRAPAGEEFYTTPVKTYHVPKIWAQTSYVSGGVTIGLVNLTDDEPAYYRVDGGAWTASGANPILASDILSPGGPQTLEVRNGTDGPVLARTMVMDPSSPAPTEEHGNLLWADEAERLAVASKVHGTQPFQHSYGVFRGSYYQGLGSAAVGDLDEVRGQWCAGSEMAARALNNALVVALEGPSQAAEEAELCKLRLLHLAKLQPIGGELSPSNTSPAKDYLCELGQPMQVYADAGIAYDILAAHYRSHQSASGMTPIEEYLIRDNLAEVAKTLLQFRGNFGASSGGGDTHWGLGYENAIGVISLAMPDYSRECYGVSGGDLTSANNLMDGAGNFWNPFPDQGVTWYEAITDPDIATPGHPNINAPFRAELLLSNDGYWTGPNGLYADGDRYFDGQLGNRLVDVKYGGLANAEGQVELVEMDGYEAPFVDRLHALDFMRRIKGDMTRPACVTNYIRRRLVGGYTPLEWDSGMQQWSPQGARVQGSLLAFNNHYGFASLPAPVLAIGDFLNNLNIYYGYASGSLAPEVHEQIDQEDRKLLYSPYSLAMCLDAPDVLISAPDENHAPIVKPLFKYVVRPGESISKKIIASDLDGDSLALGVAGMPVGMTFDSGSFMLEWTPSGDAVGVHIVTVTADDGLELTSRPFPVIVKTSIATDPIPAKPTDLTVAVGLDGASVELQWTPASGVSVASHLIYRDGALLAVAPANATSYTDADGISGGQNVIYHISVLDSAGTESAECVATPVILHVPN